MSLLSELVSKSHEKIDAKTAFEEWKVKGDINYIFQCICGNKRDEGIKLVNKINSTEMLMENKCYLELKTKIESSKEDDDFPLATADCVIC
jgi:hypothetical protein